MRHAHLKKCKQMTDDNNAINKLVERNGVLIRNMAYNDLTKLDCLTCDQRQCEVNSDERCRSVVEQYWVAQSEMVKRNIIRN